MPEKDAAELAKAMAFFEKANEAAQTTNYDYAVGLYLEGLQYDPDAVKEGHVPLCELALRRKGEGGKKPSLMEKIKRMRSKTPLEQLLGAEYLFAKDPDNISYAAMMLKAAVAGGYRKTADWIGNLIFQTNNAAEKPSLKTYLLLKDSYAAIGQFDKAVAACQKALKLKPESGELADDYKNLSAELTMSKGKYELAGDFRESIKDRESQEKLQAQQGVIKSEEYCLLAVEEARKALAEDPNQPQNIYNLAQTLSDLQSDQAENEAIELLEDACRTRKDFSFKRQAGMIKIKQLRRKAREARIALEAKPGDPGARSELTKWVLLLDETELEHYRLCVENYPTDLRAKYDYGMCLFRNERYDEAIPLFQEAQKDPHRRISAMDKIGLGFFMKGWLADAIDVFTRAISLYEIEDDDIAKELRYNLARAYEEHGDTEKALELYRKLAQLDYTFKDVRQRVDKLRNTQAGPSSQ